MARAGVAAAAAAATAAERAWMIYSYVIVIADVQIQHHAQTSYTITKKKNDRRGHMAVKKTAATPTLAQQPCQHRRHPWIQAHRACPAR
jgi:hypothetical protein